MFLKYIKKLFSQVSIWFWKPKPTKKKQSFLKRFFLSYISTLKGIEEFLFSQLKNFYFFCENSDWWKWSWLYADFDQAALGYRKVAILIAKFLKICYWIFMTIYSFLVIIACSAFIDGFFFSGNWKETVLDWRDWYKNWWKNKRDSFSFNNLWERFDKWVGDVYNEICDYLRQDSKESTKRLIQNIKDYWQRDLKEISRPLDDFITTKINEQFTDNDYFFKVYKNWTPRHAPVISPWLYTLPGENPQHTVVFYYYPEFIGIIPFFVALSLWIYFIYKFFSYYHVKLTMKDKDIETKNFKISEVWEYRSEHINKNHKIPFVEYLLQHYSNFLTIIFIPFYSIDTTDDNDYRIMIKLPINEWHKYVKEMNDTSEIHGIIWVFFLYEKIFFRLGIIINSIVFWFINDYLRVNAMFIKWLRKNPLFKMLYFPIWLLMRIIFWICFIYLILMLVVLINIIYWATFLFVYFFIDFLWGVFIHDSITYYNIHKELTCTVRDVMDIYKNLKYDTINDIENAINFTKTDIIPIINWIWEVLKLIYNNKVEKLGMRLQNDPMEAPNWVTCLFETYWQLFFRYFYEIFIQRCVYTSWKLSCVIVPVIMFIIQKWIWIYLWVTFKPLIIFLPSCIDETIIIMKETVVFFTCILKLIWNIIKEILDWDILSETTEDFKEKEQKNHLIDEGGIWNKFNKFVLETAIFIWTPITNFKTFLYTYCILYFVLYFKLLNFTANYIFFSFVNNNVNILFFIQNLFDIHFYFKIIFLIFFINFLFLKLYINKVFNLYFFLIYVVLSFILFYFHSFIGFLILSELTTITFILIMVFNYFNFYSVNVLNKALAANLLVFFTLFVGFNYKNKLGLDNLFFYFNLADNDFIGIYLILYTQSYFIIFFFILFGFMSINLIHFFSWVNFTQKNNKVKVNILQKTFFKYNKIYPKVYYWYNFYKSNIFKFK